MEPEWPTVVEADPWIANCANFDKPESALNLDGDRCVARRCLVLARHFRPVGIEASQGDALAGIEVGPHLKERRIRWHRCAWYEESEDAYGTIHIRSEEVVPPRGSMAGAADERTNRTLRADRFGGPAGSKQDSLGLPFVADDTVCGGRLTVWQRPEIDADLLGLRGVRK